MLPLFSLRRLPAQTVGRVMPAFIRLMLMFVPVPVPVPVLVFVFVFVPCGLAFSQEPRVCREPTPLPVALTLSGGVSLGTHQAGFLYYTSLVFRENPSVFQPILMTGSSAGGINTLLSLLAICGSGASGPTHNPLWQGWVGLRAADLVDPSGASPKALLSSTGFENAVKSIERDWWRGLPRSCDFIIGITATRLNPRRTQDTTNLNFGRQDEKFTLRLRGRGLGLPPSISNYVNPVSGERQTLLDLRPGEDRRNFAAFRDLLLATSAFPLAFAPQKIRYCLTNGGDPRWLHANYPLTCRPDEIEAAEFLDGGLIDNKPLGLAERLSRSGVEIGACGASRIREIPMPLYSSPRSNRGVLHILADTGAKAYPDPTNEAGQPGAMDILGLFLGGFKDSVRSRDSVAALEEDPGLARQVAAARNRYPRIGEPLLGFFGFFETDFRIFDFYLGMLEARVFFRDELATSLMRGPQRIGRQLRLPEERENEDDGWLALHCIEAVLHARQPDRPQACVALNKPNLEILARLSLARLERFCLSQARGQAPARSESQSVSHAQSHSHLQSQSQAQAQARGPSQRVQGESVGAAYEACRATSFGGPVKFGRSEQTTDDLDFIFRFLTENRFEFRDLGLDRARAGEGAAKIKTASLDIFSDLAGAQPAGESFVVRSALPVVLNAVAHLPTERYAFMTAGPATRAGFSFLQAGATYPPMVRLNFGAQIENLQGWFAQDGENVVFSPWAGLEFEPPAWMSTFIQTRVVFNAGYRYNSAVEGGRSNECVFGKSSPIHCRGVLLQTGISTTLLERVRIELLGEVMPFVRSDEVPFQILPGIGLQFYF